MVETATFAVTGVALNIIVVIENQSNKQRYEQEPYPFRQAGRARLCGNLIRPILGAWRPQCGAKVIEVRNEITEAGVISS